MPNSGKLIVISGPSGVGKGTLVREIVDRVPSLSVSVSATTRLPRSGEIEGKHYHFMSPGEFDQRLADGEFLESAEVFGNKYGTLKREVESKISQGISVLLEIDVQGARQVKDAIDSDKLVSIFIKPPSLAVLEERLRGRGADSEEAILYRLRIAEEELREEEWYDKTIVNDSLADAIDELESFIVK